MSVDTQQQSTEPEELTDQELIERIAALDPEKYPLAERCRSILARQDGESS